MFTEIRKKITLGNALTLFAFLILFIFFLFSVVRWSLTVAGESYLEEVARTIAEGKNPEVELVAEASSVHGQLGYEYLKWSENRSILSQQTSEKSMIETGYALAGIDSDPDSSLFVKREIQGNTYRIYQTHIEEKGKIITLQVFQNITPEQTLLTNMLMYLFPAGLIGLLILVPISYVMAGRSLKPIKENYELQKTFIADASHELRTPITVIRTNLEVLEMKENQTIAQNQKWLKAIDEECTTMANLISELLKNAQGQETARSDENLKGMNLSHVCSESVKKLVPLARDRDLSLLAQISPDIHYRGSERKISQLLRIFLDNAMKYTPAGGTIILSLSQNKKEISISIQDNGLGIPKEDQKKIFSRFYRVDDARSRMTGGSGLGLSIADGLVRSMKGKIVLRSELGEGSTFTILLPKRKKEFKPESMQLSLKKKI